MLAGQATLFQAHFKIGYARPNGVSRCLTHGQKKSDIEQIENMNGFRCVSRTLPYACCVLVENGDSGGGVAAPIAAGIFKYLLDVYGTD